MNNPLPIGQVPSVTGDTGKQPDLTIQLKLDHEQWLLHPVTKTLIRHLENRIGQLVNSLASVGASPEKTNRKEYLEVFSAQLHETIKINKIINETELFVPIVTRS